MPKSWKLEAEELEFGYLPAKTCVFYILGHNLVPHSVAASNPQLSIFHRSSTAFHGL